jgi:uncharacterized membrane protein YgcG
VRELDLSGNHLPALAEALPNTIAFLTAAPRLERLVLARTGLPVNTIVELVCRVRALRELDLSDCAAIVDEARDLVGLLRASHTLASLRVNGLCRVRSPRARCVDWALSLATLIGSPCPLVTLQIAACDDAADVDATAADGGGSGGSGSGAGSAGAGSAASDSGGGGGALSDEGGVWAAYGAPMPMRVALLPVIEQLGVNRTLGELDLTGQQLGDAGAHALALALRTNRTLRTLRCDRNAFSLDAFESLAGAMRVNVALAHFEYPTFDVASAIESASAHAQQGGSSGGGGERAQARARHTALCGAQRRAPRDADGGNAIARRHDVR